MVVSLPSVYDALRGARSPQTQPSKASGGTILRRVEWSQQDDPSTHPHGVDGVLSRAWVQRRYFLKTWSDTSTTGYYFKLNKASKVTFLRSGFF